VDIGAVPN